ASQANYRVTVSNSLGTATGTNAFLRVLAPQYIRNIERDSSGLFHFEFADAQGGARANPSNIQIEAVSKLRATNLFWTALTNASILVTNGVFYFQDPDASDFPRRFYRVVELP